MKKYLVLSILVFGFVACSAKKNVVENTKDEITEIENLSPELAQGKLLYDSKCAKCHDLPNPSKYSKEKWQPIMLRMQKAAKISDAERDLVYNYVTRNH